MRLWGGFVTQGGSVKYDDQYSGTLSDDLGNMYQRGISPNVYLYTSTSLYPGKSEEQKVTFESPVDRASYLKLELPAENFGGEGMLRIQIPISMIERSK